MYNVTIGAKHPRHLFYGKGSKSAYIFNGEENKTLMLIRGKSYSFNVQAPTHPLFFTKSSIGGSEHRNESLMGPNEVPTDDGILTFFIRDDLPNSFYYQCYNHPKMGGKVIVIEPEDLVNIIV